MWREPTNVSVLFLWPSSDKLIHFKELSLFLLRKLLWSHYNFIHYRLYRSKKEVEFNFKIMMMMIWIIPFRVLFILLIAAWSYRVPSLEIWQCKGQLSDFSSPQNDAHSLEWGYLQSSKELSKGDKNLALWFNAYDKWNTKAFFTKGQHIKKISFALWLKIRMIIFTF